MKDTVVSPEVEGAQAFTPGPWIRDPRWGHLIGRNGESVNAHALGIGVVCGGSPSATEVANTSLIAAAPDLYEALDDVLAEALELGLPEKCNTISAARAALAKAQVQP